MAALGDGGVLMAIAELETAVRLGLRLLVVVYNDAAYGAEVHHFGPDGIRWTPSGSPTPTSPRSAAASAARGDGARPADLDVVRLAAGRAGTGRW